MNQIQGLLLLLFLLFTTPSLAQNQALHLDGDGDYVQLPAEVLAGLNAITVECWVRWDSLQYFSQPFNLGAAWQVMAVNHFGDSGTLQFFLYNRQENLHLIKLPGLLEAGRWYHLAATVGSDQLQLYVNGVWVGSTPFAGSLAAVAAGGENYLGRSSWAENKDFKGQLDEVRVWAGVRTQEQIRATMHQRLRGGEEGLAGLWNFDRGDGRDSALRGHHGQLQGDAHCAPVALPLPGELPLPAVVHGMAGNEAGQPLSGAQVRLEQGEELLVEVETDSQGRYSLALMPPRRPCDLRAAHGELRGSRWGLRLLPGERRRLDLRLSPAISIEGTLLALDLATPQVGVVVQALGSGPGTAGTSRQVLSDAKGHYRFVHLRPGQYQVFCQTPGGPLGDTVPAQGVQVQEGQTRQVDFRFAPFKKGHWKTYTYLDGLASNRVRDICLDAEGVLWFATYGGVSRWDGKVFTTFTAANGLPHDYVESLMQDHQGIWWFATRGGAVRWDGKTLSTLTAADGLPHNHVTRVFADHQGRRWFATWGGGVARQEGGDFVRFGQQDLSSKVYTIHQDPEDRWWFATVSGVLRYDGQRFETFGEGDGLSNAVVRTLLPETGGKRLWIGTEQGVSYWEDGRFARLTPAKGLDDDTWDLLDDACDAILQDQAGALWLGTPFGAVHYARGQYTTFMPQDGLAGGGVMDFLQGEDGALWVATERGVSRFDGETRTFGLQDGLPSEDLRALGQGVEGAWWVGSEKGLSRWDGRSFRTFAAGDGLVSEAIQVIHADQEGGVWLGTTQGLSHLAGRVFRSFTIEDGLADNYVRAIYREANGVLWVGTLKGLSRYDGRAFRSFGQPDGLNDSGITALCPDGEGGLWVGTEKGLSHYDGRRFGPAPVQDHLADGRIRALHQDPDGALWVGTERGLYRNEQGRSTRFTVQEGLVSNQVISLFRDAQGWLWCGTEDGGVCAYDGRDWTALDIRDGLAGNRVSGIGELADGALLFATEKGLTQYRRNPQPPRVRLTALQADSLYTDLSSLPAFAAGHRLTLHYRAVDFKTLPQKRQYRWRIAETDSAWSPAGRSEELEWTPQQAGTYTFEVQAIDRDLNHSAPARLVLEIVPPWYRNAWIVLPLGGGGLALLVVSVFSSLRYYTQRRESAHLRGQMLEQERQARLALETKNRQLEQARQEAEAASRAKSAFLANMSHEIRTPMNAILGYAQILEDDPGLNPAQRQAIHTIETSGDHLLGLINEVLDLAKIEAGRQDLKAQDFDLAHLVQNLSAMFELRCRQQGLAWRAVLEGEGWQVRGDELKLRQVLLNLLGNAVKFSEQGEVSLTLRAVGGGQYYFAVQDQGPGIAPERQAAIFAPFEQGEEGQRKGGTGLGLAIARRHVELMGGRLDLESAPGQGARFSFTLSLPPAQQLIGGPAPGRVLHLRPGTQVEVLIADDVAENRQVLSQLLEVVGVRVRQAASGPEALELARQLLPDLVLSDVRMPGMDGVELMRRLWAEHGRGKVHIAAISASVLAHQKQEYLDAGFEAFIDKPFRKEHLYACLGELLGVEYEYAPAAEAGVPASWQGVRLPPALLGRLREAAQVYALTALDGCLVELEQLSPEGRQLAAALRALSRQYDMEAILRIIGEIGDA